ncbi:hypothetical protein LXL04_003214 [Taraxacum kok-saghyz]
MKKSERAKATKLEDGVDLLSSMPDAVLLLILSRLSSTEEQIRSSIFSRRWRYLWTAFPSLDMSFVAIPFGGKFTKNEFKEFMYWVSTSKTVDLDSFLLDCFDYYSMSTVWRWIHVAVKRNVKELNLSCCATEKTEAVELPHCLVTCCSLEVLTLILACSGLRLPKLVGFPALRVLNLTRIVILEDDDLVKDFLESCPSLEVLTLFDCLLHKLDLLWISCPKLKSLRIVGCWENEGCDGIKISCPKLVYVDLIGYIAGNFFFEHLDSLKEAVIQPYLEVNIDPMLFHGNSHVKSLWMNLYFSCKCIKSACDPGLPNLKSLEIQSTMDAFTVDELIRCLKYCPKLENLKLNITKVCSFQMEFDEECEWLDEDKIRRLWTSDVKRVEFFEFNGEKPKLDIILHESILDMFFTWGR